MDIKSSLLDCYGGIPSCGGYSCHTEYEIGHQVYCEAVHCILGSIQKALFTGYLSIEEGHIKEELHIMQNTIEEYSRPIYNQQLTRKSIYPDKTIANMQTVSIKLLEISKKQKALIGNVRSDIKLVAECCYDCLINLASVAMGINSLNCHYYNTFDNVKVKLQTDKLSNAIAKLKYINTLGNYPQITDNYPIINSNTVDGRTVLNEVPNLLSIEATLDNYTVLPGIREVQMSEFELTGKSYSEFENNRIRKLAECIKNSNEISPLIVVYEKEGPYILEGTRRIDALYLLGAKSFPAVVVINNE